MKTPIEPLKQEQRTLIRTYATATDREGWIEVLTTLVPLALLWWLAVWGFRVNCWITAAATAGITIMLLRVFSLMHECGHGSLFKSQKLNRALGFVFGVLSGMPQYVWSQHHAHHHRTNGNWDRYRGPLTTLSIDEYEQLTGARQWLYRSGRHLAMAPLAGFVYLIFNPRVNWVKGIVALAIHALRGKLTAPRVSLRNHAATFQTRYWKTSREFRHQTANNLVLLSMWVLMCQAVGPGLFFAIYLTSLSLAGAAGMVLFTVQHNFEESYASSDQGWDRDLGALAGTSYLVFPLWLNWATANIGYHHIHHLASTIPCYRLPRCHEEHRHLFEGVTRISLTEIPRHLKCILWDKRAGRITSVKAYRRQRAASE